MDVYLIGCVTQLSHPVSSRQSQKLVNDVDGPPPFKLILGHATNSLSGGQLSGCGMIQVYGISDFSCTASQQRYRHKRTSWGLSPIRLEYIPRTASHTCLV